MARVSISEAARLVKVSRPTIYKMINSGKLSYTSVVKWICPYISRHLLSLNPLLARCRRYSRGER